MTQTLVGTGGKVAGKHNSGPVVYEGRGKRSAAFCFFALGTVEKIDRFDPYFIEFFITHPTMADYVINLYPRLFDKADPPVNPEDLIGEQVIAGWRGDYWWVDFDPATDRKNLNVLHIITGTLAGRTLISG